MGGAETVLAVRMRVLMPLGEPALWTGRSLALAAFGLARSGAARWRHGMIDLRSAGDRSFVGPGCHRPACGRASGATSCLPCLPLVRSRCRRLGGQKLAGHHKGHHKGNHDARHVPRREAT